jgi:hypothetical protein
MPAYYLADDDMPGTIRAARCFLSDDNGRGFGSEARVLRPETIRPSRRVNRIAGSGNSADTARL